MSLPGRTPLLPSAYAKSKGSISISAAECAKHATSLTDPVGHGFGMLGMIGGAILCAVGAVLLIAGEVRHSHDPLLCHTLFDLTAAKTKKARPKIA
jgi:hypothetical protein